MTITRLPDWPIRFDALVYSRLRRPFAWGINDCALFAGDAVAAITGVDLSAGLRGHGTALQAARTLRRHGGLRGIATACLGEPIAPGQARQGDVMLIDAMGREALAVCVNAQDAVAPGPQGLHVVPRDSALCAWRVG